MTAVSLTQELVRINTAGANEHAAASLLAERLGRCRAQVRLVDHGTGRAGLIAELGGGDLPITLTGHLDTVPLGNAAWSRDPFAAEIEDGRLYGRGSSDTKSGVAAIVTAIERLSADELRRSGVRIILTVGEETGCEGARDLLAREELGPSGPLIVAEPTRNRPFVGHKGALWLTLETSGKAAHASRPELGDNAIYKLTTAIDGIRSWPPAGAAHPVMGNPTLSVGTISGGIAPNLVPDRAHAVIDIRTVADMKHDDVVATLRGIAHADARLTAMLGLPPVFTDPDDPWVRTFRGLCARLTGEPAATPETAAYFTDAAVLAPALGNPPVVICGPGEPSCAHAVDEYCHTRDIETASEIYLTAIRHWCT